MLDLNGDEPLFSIPVGDREARKDPPGPSVPIPVPSTENRPSFDDLWNQVMGSKDSKSKSKSKTKKGSSSTTVDVDLREKRKQLQKERPKKAMNGAGYEYVRVWNEDGSDYKMVTRGRVEMEKILGRSLQDHEKVFFRNRTLKGDAKYAPENLVLGLKSGVSLDMFTCGNCGCRGNWVPEHLTEERGPASD